jgi:hypothetical protein
MDTLVMHRGPLREDLSDSKTNVWQVTFSIIKDGVESTIDLGDDVEMFMFGDKASDEKGDNKLSKDEYKLTFAGMPSHPEWENTINVAAFGVFVHPAKDYSWLGGCKGVCTEFSQERKEYLIDYEDNPDEIFTPSSAENTKESLATIRALYDSYEPNLSGDKFLLRTNSVARSQFSGRARPPLPTRYRDILKRYRN